jgi:hypothetical protein
MWTNRGSKDMVAYWANMYGWQDDALNQQQSVPITEMVLGLDCLFPPPDPNLPPPVPHLHQRLQTLRLKSTGFWLKETLWMINCVSMLFSFTILGWHERCRYIKRRLKYV